MEILGAAFARAIAAGDAATLRGVLADPIDFQALTPRRHWQASTSAEVAWEIILRSWFGDARIDELSSVVTGRVAEREHVAYRLRVSKGNADYLVEQQAYYTIDNGRIGWMRILCSGYMPVLAVA